MPALDMRDWRTKYDTNRSGSGCLRCILGKILHTGSRYYVDGFDPASSNNSPLAGQNLRIQILNPIKNSFPYLILIKNIRVKINGN
jgi:hypothetical protein